MLADAMSQSAYLGTHTALVPRCNGTYISMTMVFTIVVSTAWSITVLQDIANRIAHLILMAHSVTRNSCEFLM